MTYLLTWIGLAIAVVGYRMVAPTSTSFMEHATGIYYAGVALLIHWISSLGWKPRIRSRAVDLDVAPASDASASMARRLGGKRSLWFAAVFGVVVGVFVIAMVFVLGLSFGQRCERAYPGDGKAQEACVQRLVKGDKA